MRGIKDVVSVLRSESKLFISKKDSTGW